MAESWIQLADITLHSGRRSSFKIECDALADETLSAMCALLAKILPPFLRVKGVPTGGTRVAEAMTQWRTGPKVCGSAFPDDPPGLVPLLIVDDVWTTGASLREYRAGYSCPTIAAVLFARGPTPPDVTALFTLHEGLWTA